MTKKKKPDSKKDPWAGVQVDVGGKPFTIEDLERMMEELEEIRYGSSTRREIRLRRIATMKQKGVVLKKPNSKVLWEVIEVGEHVTPGHLLNWGPDKKTDVVTIQSKNSGQKRKILPIATYGKYDIVEVPEACKVLYGMKEDK